MVYGCCTTIDKYDLLISSGYDRIILPAADITAMNTETFEQLTRTLGGPVKCHALNNFCTPQLRLCGDRYSEEAVADYSRLLAERASRLGVRYIGVGAPKSRSIPPDFPRGMAVDQFEKSMRALSSACARYDIVVLLEAVCELECNFITTTEEAADFVEYMKADNFKLVFDTYHAYMMGEDAAPLRRAIKHIELVHIAQNIDNQRHYLRHDNFAEYQVFFNALLEGGYDGEVSVEAFYDDMEEQLDETLEIMKRLCSPADI